VHGAVPESGQTTCLRLCWPVGLAHDAWWVPSSSKPSGVTSRCIIEHSEWIRACSHDRPASSAGGSMHANNAHKSNHSKQQVPEAFPCRPHSPLPLHNNVSKMMFILSVVSPRASSEWSGWPAVLARCHRMPTRGASEQPSVWDHTLLLAACCLCFDVSLSAFLKARSRQRYWRHSTAQHATPS
jgi:hypothetical protein